MGNLIGGLLSTIPKVFYFLTMSLVTVLDVLQMLFRKLAGLDCYYKDGVTQTGDILYDFLRGIFVGDYNILSSVFWGMVVLAAILLFMSTFIAIIRSEYTTEKDGNGKGKIIGKAFKSIIYVAIIPIICIFGVYLANIFLVAVDKATTYNTSYTDTLDKSKLQTVKVYTYSLGQENATETYITYSLFNITDEEGLPYGTTTTTFSGTIFKAAAYGCNRIRTTANETADKNYGNFILSDDDDTRITTFNGLFSDPNGDTQKIATQIDIAFGDNVVFKEDCREQLYYGNAYVSETINNDAWNPFYKKTTEVQTYANKFNVQLVWYYYDLWQFNYIVAIGAGVIMISILVNVTFGLMRRLIELIGLFLMAPPLIALMPLDDEKAYKGWRGKFLSNTLMAYGAVAGMNVVMLILPELQTIEFFQNDFLNWLTDTLLVIVALLAVKDFIAMISGFIGGADANKTGEGVAKETGALVAKAGKLAAATVGVGAAATFVGGKALWKLGKKAKDEMKYDSLMEDPDKVNAKATAKARFAARGEDRAAAEEKVFNDYKKTQNLRTVEAELSATHGKKFIKNLKSTDGEAYQKLLDEQLRSDYKAYREKNKAAEESKVTAEFNARQKTREVKNKDAAKETQYGSKMAAKEEYKDTIADMKAGGFSRADIRMVKKAHHAEGRHNFAQGVSGAVKVAKPLTTGLKNWTNVTIDSTVGNNAFANEMLGKDYENLKDFGARLLGQKQADLAKAKQKKKEAEVALKGAQQQAQLNAQAMSEIIEKLNRER